MGRPRKTTDDASPGTAAKLRATALAHFARYGVARTSLARVAEEVGVTRTTLLYHCESKEKLYRQILEDAFGQLATMLASELTAGGDHRAQLARLVSRSLAFIEARPHLAKLILRELVDEDGPGPRLIEQHGLPVLTLVEALVLRTGRYPASEAPLLREVLLTIAGSVLVKAAAGDLRKRLWTGEGRTKELATLLLEGIVG